MAFTGITATEDHIDQKTGAGVSLLYTDTMKTQALLQAESYINAITKYNWSDWYAGTPNVDIKYLITEVTSSIVAMEGIAYDMSGYTSRAEAEKKLDLLRDRIDKIMKELVDDKVRTEVLAIGAT